MKNTKSIFSLMLCLIMLFSALPINAFAQDNENNSDVAFSGTRTIQLYSDFSDLDNYIDGGRSNLDLAIRSAKPDWVKYSIHADGRIVYVDLSFDFESYEDYTSKTNELLGEESTIIYDTSNGLLFLESHSTVDLLNFVESFLYSKNCLNELELDEILKASKNEILLNGTTYQSGKRLAIRPENTLIELSTLIVETTINSDGTFDRTIKVHFINKTDEKDRLKKRFEDVGEVSEPKSSGNLSYLDVNFKAETKDDLINKTMNCLNTSVSIYEYQAYLNEQTVSVKRHEVFNLENIMAENGTFNYTQTLPDSFKNVAVKEEKIKLSESKITAKNVDDIYFTYDRGIQFSNIDITIDCLNLFGKTKATLNAYLPLNIAESYHESIINTLSDNLDRGMVLEIYDEGTQRVYSISYSTFVESEISEFINTITNGTFKTNYTNNWILYGKSEVTTSGSFKDYYPNMQVPASTSINVKLPKLAKVVENGDIKAEKTEDGYKLVTINNKDSVNITFKTINLLKLIIELSPILIVLIIVLVIIKKIKNKKKAKNKINDNNDNSLDEKEERKPTKNKDDSPKDTQM